MLEPELLKWIYSINPYNYADISAFVKKVRPETNHGELHSLTTLSKKNIVLLQNVDLDNLPQDLKKLGETMVSLSDQGRHDVENWRFHDDTLRVGRRANRLALVAGIFIFVYTLATVYQVFFKKS